MTFKCEIKTVIDDREFHCTVIDYKGYQCTTSEITIKDAGCGLAVGALTDPIVDRV